MELGEFSEKIHKQVGEEVYKSGVDILICRGENAKYIAEEVKKLGMPEQKVYYLESNNEIENKLKEILLKASNGMKFFEIAEKM